MAVMGCGDAEPSACQEQLEKLEKVVVFFFLSVFGSIKGRRDLEGQNSRDKGNSEKCAETVLFSHLPICKQWLHGQEIEEFLEIFCGSRVKTWAFGAH